MAVYKIKKKIKNRHHGWVIEGPCSTGKNKRADIGKYLYPSKFKAKVYLSKILGITISELEENHEY